MIPLPWCHDQPLNKMNTRHTAVKYEGAKSLTTLYDFVLFLTSRHWSLPPFPHADGQHRFRSSASRSVSSWRPGRRWTLGYCHNLRNHISTVDMINAWAWRQRSFPFHCSSWRAVLFFWKQHGISRMSTGSLSSVGSCCCRRRSDHLLSMFDH